MENSKAKAPVKNSFLMSTEDIKKVLPHRYPFLLVDRVTSMTDTSITAIKNVSNSEPYFQGHFPTRPVMPGVLMVESLAQTGGILMLSKLENHGKMAYLASIENARFRKLVTPGDQLILHVELVKLKSRIGLVKGSATVDGEEVCSADIMFSLAD